MDNLQECTLYFLSFVCETLNFLTWHLRPNFEKS